MRIQLPDPTAIQKIFSERTGVVFDNPVTGLTIDSRLVQPGDLYIALKGEHVDGHQFISDAQKKGAVACLVRKQEASIDNLQQIVVDDPLNTIGDIAHYWRKQFDIPVIGITGTNGKTSTKELLKHIFQHEYTVHATEGNFNTSISLPLTLLLLNETHTISVLEMGASAPGDIAYLARIANPTHGLITNIAPAHLEGFGSVDNIVQEKRELYHSLKNGISFVNKSDIYISTFHNEGISVTFGFTPDCDFSADIYHEKNDGITLIINSMEIQTFSQNMSFAKNVLSAAAVAITMGVSWETFQNQIQTFTPPKGRCTLKQFNNVTFIDDTYNANLESTLAAIDYLKSFNNSGQQYFIFGDMFELGEETISAHRKIGEKCMQKKLDGVFTIGAETKTTYNTLNSGMLHKHFSSKKDCISFVGALIKPGDVVLVKGSRGMEMETIIKGLIG